MEPALWPTSVTVFCGVHQPAAPPRTPHPGAAQARRRPRRCCFSSRSRLPVRRWPHRMPARLPPRQPRVQAMVRALHVMRHDPACGGDHPLMRKGAKPGRARPGCCVESLGENLRRHQRALVSSGPRSARAPAGSGRRLRETLLKRAIRLQRLVRHSLLLWRQVARLNVGGRLRGLLPQARGGLIGGKTGRPGDPTAPLTGHCRGYVGRCPEHQGANPGHNRPNTSLARYGGQFLRSSVPGSVSETKNRDCTPSAA